MVGIPCLGGYVDIGIWVDGDEEREAVVGEAGLEVGAEEDVGGLEIAVDETPRLVDVGKTLCYVLCYF